MKVKKTKEGISLIILVITIIIMIVLAAVIMLSLSSDGIISKASVATASNDLAELQSAVTLKLAEKKLEGESLKTRYKVSELDIESKYEDIVVIEDEKIRVLDIAEDHIRTAAQNLGMLVNENTLMTDSMRLENTKGYDLLNYKIYGKSKQDTTNETPSITNPVSVISLGENSKNKFDESKYKLLSQYNIVSGRAYSYSIIPLKPNTTYKVSVKRYNGFDGKGKGYLLLSDIQNINGSTWTTIAHETADISYTNYSYTTGADGILYIGYFVSTMTQQNLDYIWENTDVQIEEGQTATTYVPHRYIDVISSGKNLFNRHNYTVIDGYIGFDVSRLKIGKRYTISSDLPMTWIKITNYRSGYGSVQTTGNITNYTFTMSKHPNMDQNATQYLFIGVSTPSDFVKSINELAGYNIQIEEGESSTAYEPYQNPITTRIDLTGHEPLRKIGNLVDYIDYSNSRIVRNTGSSILDDNMNWRVSENYVSNLYNYTIAEANIGAYFPALSNYGFKAGMYTTGTYYGITSWSGTTQGSSGWLFIRPPESANVTSVETLKAWLKIKKDAGTPVTIYYQLHTPKYESIDLPKIPTLNGTTVLKLNSNIEASNVMVAY